MAGMESNVIIVWLFILSFKLFSTNYYTNIEFLA